MKERGDIYRQLLDCAAAWDGDACIVGNVTATELESFCGDAWADHHRNLDLEAENERLREALSKVRAQALAWPGQNVIVSIVESALAENKQKGGE